MDSKMPSTTEGSDDIDDIMNPYNVQTTAATDGLVHMSVDDVAAKDRIKPKGKTLQSNGNGDAAGRPRKSSTYLRNLPPQLNIRSERDVFHEQIKMDTAVKEKSRFNLAQKICLNSRYSLRKQIMLSFGITITITILFVMIASILVTISTTNNVKSDGKQAILEVMDVIAKSSPRYVSELLTLKIPVEPVSIIAEAVMDRFAGYPYHEGYMDDSAVPFYDIITKQNKYPLNSSSLPLDWQIDSNVNGDNYQEHVQDRWFWYGKNPNISTRSAGYVMQGACDPSITDPLDSTYFENCTDANNDIDTGGAVTPSPTNKHIARKAADLNFLLKSIYELYQDISDVGIYFANAGAGSAMNFPHYALNSTGSYISAGCEWMSQDNPYDESRAIASEEERKRCRPEGVKVNSRAYNVLERDWCQQMALNPFHSHIVGPVQDAWGSGLWHMLVGRAIYDRITNEFIACAMISVPLRSIDEIVEGVDILHELEGEGAKVSVVKWDEEGTILASTEWDWSSATEPATIETLNIEKGMNKEIFEEIKSLVNFSEKWDPEEARRTFENTTYENDGILISAFPLPAIPNNYTEAYSPQFMVILSIKEVHLENTLNSMSHQANDTEERLIIIILACGAAGILASFIFIFQASNYLTKPLKYMNDISEQIVNQFGQHDDKDIDCTSPVVFRCSPKTELNIVVEEFQKMISRFSGTGSAKVDDCKLIEVKNSFNLFSEFHKLYFSRMDPNYKLNYYNSAERTPNNTKNNGEPVTETALSQQSTPSSLMVPRRCHLGENIIQPEVVEDDNRSYSEKGSGRKKLIYSSPLFWWIMGLIVTPLLVTTITISAIVTWKLSDELPSLFKDVEGLYIDIQKDYISSAVMLRADFTDLVTKRGLRELQIVNRVVSWLFSGGIVRSGSITEITSATEKCKVYEEKSCPHFKNKTAAPCDCQWNDVYSRSFNRTCYDYNDHSRYLQKLSYMVQTQDTRANGDRNSTSYPDVAFSPETTAWLESVSDAPGFREGRSAGGYMTTYDRMAIASALSIIIIPLYNYDKSDDKSVGTAVSFEADGMFVGYSGCGDIIADLSHWKSTEENGAFKLRPELCPEGKYGFDPRCRGWYDSGKKKWEKGGANSSLLYVTAPYPFAGNFLAGQSCTLPIVDSIANHRIGQTIVDFFPTSIFSSLEEKNTILFEKGFAFVIAEDGGTVIGPGYTKITNDMKPAIEELVVPYDNVQYDNSCTNTDGFEMILCDMKKGGNDTTSFTRLNEDKKKETVYISYAPVNVNHFFPWDSSDFSRGVKEFKSMIYSIALVVPESRRFQKSMDALHRDVYVAIGVLCALIVIGTACVTSVLSRITASITDPMLRLLEEIKKVNRLEVHDAPPRFALESGSRDIQNVCDTFKVLFLVVHLANSAYFSGDIEVAHKVLVDTLSAFKRLQNKKAIGVASNNLGNIMLAMYRTMSTSGDEMICSLTKQQIISRGTDYFLQAIKLGEETYDRFYEEEGWSKNCLVFMQHLSNRYFNRAIFLLTVQKDHETPDLAKQMAFRDLEIVFDMDIEVVDQCVEMGVVRSKKEHFDSIMGRIRGLQELLKLSYPDEWNLEELLDNALKLLKSVISKPSNELFSTLKPAGRMQQLDCQFIKYIKATRGNVAEAARIAIRMLVEDECVLCAPYLTAIGTMIEYCDSASSEDFPYDIAAIKRELFSMRSLVGLEVKEHSLYSSENPTHSLGDLAALSPPPHDRDETMMTAQKIECNRGDVTMETF